MLQCIHKVTFDDRPTSHIEYVCEAVSPRRLIEGHSFDGLENLLFREQFFQMREVKGGRSSTSRLIEASRAGADQLICIVSVHLFGYVIPSRVYPTIVM